MLMREGKEREESKMIGHFLNAEESGRNTFSEQQRARLWPSALGNPKLKKSHNP